jgi:hypothetical protein
MTMQLAARMDPLEQMYARHHHRQMTTVQMHLQPTVDRPMKVTRLWLPMAEILALVELALVEHLDQKPFGTVLLQQVPLPR